jgi:hypothetical protein
VKYIEHAFSGTNTYTGNEVKQISQVLFKNSQFLGNASNSSQEAQDMTDLLRAYWKLALKRFVDNVQQIIDQVTIIAWNDFSRTSDACVFEL